MVDTMVMVLDTMVMDMDMDCGDARRGKLKPNLLLLPNHLLIHTSTMDVDMVFMVDTMVMVLDTMVMVLDMAMDATIGENKPHNPTTPNINILPQSALMETMMTFAFGTGLILYLCTTFLDNPD